MFGAQRSAQVVLSLVFANLLETDSRWAPQRFQVRLEMLLIGSATGPVAYGVGVAGAERTAGPAGG